MALAAASLVTISVFVAACGGSDLPSPDERLLDVTDADLVGPLCTSRRCDCKEAPDDAGSATGSQKRYEIRIGPTPGEMWVTIGDDRLYKSPQRATECFYVDLDPGEHEVTARARGENGFSAAVRISELGDSDFVEDGPWWYDTFHFNCGAPGRCTMERLAHWQQRFRNRAVRNVLDTCGSTAIRDIAWRTGDVRERVYPTSIYLQFLLDVYDFDTLFPPGHPECAS